MNGKRGLRVLAVVAIAVLTITACAPVVAPVSEGEQKDVVVQPVSRELDSKLDLEGDGNVAIDGDRSTPVVAQPGATLGLEDQLTELYRETNPSVVYIVVTNGQTGFAASGGTGTGWVYGADGTIVTNNHVVESGSYFEVVFPNGARMEAELIGADPDSDLAVLQVESLPKDAGPLPLGDSDAIEIGQFAIAIGNPFGEQSSMSMGIISGLDRSLPSQRATTSGSTYSLPAVIQTDAPINPGNSGGPLLDLDGRVIGVNAAIASTSGTSSGVGFSIPVSVVKRVVPSLIEDGEVAYPYMGVSFDGEISLPEMEVYDIDQTRGAYVITVTPDSPADEAGLIGADPETGRGGDLVIAIGDREVDTFSDLNSYLVLEAAVGDTIDITVIRDGEEVVLPLTLGERP